MSTFTAWLALREPADARARALALVDLLRPHLDGPLEVHDLGCGTGSMGRWLAPLLPTPQHWVLHDHDAELLALAAAHPPPGASVETRHGDVTRLSPDAVAGAGLVTSSALLDVLTEDELSGFVDACVASVAPVLVTLDVTGRVELDPAHPLDVELRDAFNAHQRREARGARLLGPDAPGAAVAAFRGGGYVVHTDTSPWRLDTAQGELLRAWMDGWVRAAVELRPELAVPAEEWVVARRDALDAGVLTVTVDHEDLLALPPESTPA